MEIVFKFELDEKVTTVLGDEGIVEMCAYARAGNQYLITLAGGKDVWLYEDRLVRGHGFVPE